MICWKRSAGNDLLETKRGRDKVRSALEHFKDLDPRFANKLNPSDRNLANILRLLKDLGAPATCHLISSNSELDGREMALPEALTAVLGRGFGAFISCVPGKLAYFEDEEPRERYICRRRP